MIFMAVLPTMDFNLVCINICTRFSPSNLQDKVSDVAINCKKSCTPHKTTRQLSKYSKHILIFNFVGKRKILALKISM